MRSLLQIVAGSFLTALFIMFLWPYFMAMPTHNEAPTMDAVAPEIAPREFPEYKPVPADGTEMTLDWNARHAQLEKEADEIAATADRMDQRYKEMMEDLVPSVSRQGDFLVLKWGRPITIQARDTVFISIQKFPAMISRLNMELIKEKIEVEYGGCVDLKIKNNNDREIILKELLLPITGLTEEVLIEGVDVCPDWDDYTNFQIIDLDPSIKDLIEESSTTPTVHFP